jgi:hypothetical protein
MMEGRERRERHSASQAFVSFLPGYPSVAVAVLRERERDGSTVLVLLLRCSNASSQRAAIAG